MKQTSFTRQATQTTGQATRQNLFAGPGSIALAPPAYGIDLIDQQSAQLESEREPNDWDLESLTSLEEDEAIQRYAAPTLNHATGGDRQPNTTGLPDQLKAGIEHLSGLSLDDVNVHYNSSKPTQLQALAYTKATDIYVAPGQERHLPHEAWHVVQQKQGRVRPTIQVKGVAINDDPGLEREADLMGALAWRHGGPDLSAATVDSESTTAIQRQAAVPGLAHSAPSGRDVVQLATTTLRFDPNITGNSPIVASQHTRSGVHETAWKWVLNNGAWKTVPSGASCNHSQRYGDIAQKILDSIHDKPLSTAANYVKTSYETLQGKNQGLGTATSKHQERMDEIIDNPNNLVDTDDAIDSFNYYIFKICDYPRNLFYWPNKTGGDPDMPKGLYGNNNVPLNAWKVRKPLFSRKKRLDVEKKRLNTGRHDLDQALG